MNLSDFRVVEAASGFCRVEKPHFSWKLRSDERDTKQIKFELVILKDGKTIARAAGEGESVYVLPEGEALAPRTQYEARLTVEDNHGCRAGETLIFETDKLSEPFAAKMIAPTEAPAPVYALKGKFTAQKPVRSARLYATALGLYECYFGGKKAGDSYFAPFWTSYSHTLEYQTYDVTSLIQEGENDFEMLIGKGWYAGALGFMKQRGIYGGRTSGMAEIRLYYEDGTGDVFGTDESFTTVSTYIADSEFYFGETQDFTKEEKSSPVEVISFSAKVVGQINEPVRCTQVLKPISCFHTPKGEYVLDFGQNFTGFVSLEVEGERGETITLRHAEVLDKEGNFYTENLREATSEDTFILAGGKQVLTPHFTFHGFRYLQIVGKELPKEDVTGLVLHSDMKQTGKFECSDPRVERLWQNIVWGQRSNFVDVPTDCPQRDERLGWTGDANVFFRTAAFNYDVSSFFNKWLLDLASEQRADGSVPHVIPDILSGNDGAALWSDCATMIPWNEYLVYGDQDALRVQFPAMKKWVDFVHSRCSENGLWQTGYQYGDWLALDGSNPATRTGSTDKHLVANVFYYVSTDIVAKAAEVLGEEALAKQYAARADAIKAAFQTEYFTATGRLVSETQTACVLTLYFGLVPDEMRARVIGTLKTNLSEHNNHLVTGFAGTPYLLFALSENGIHDLAEKLLFHEDFPSWLYAVKMGATTIWERWDGILPDGSLHEPSMNSFNHYSYGSVGDWLYRVVAGIRETSPGYRTLKLAPTLTKGLESVRAQFESVYGTVVSGYECREGKLRVFVTVPANCTAQVVIPEHETVTVGSGSYEWEYETKTDLKLQRYTMETRFGSILDMPEGRAILNELSPGMLDGPMVELARDMTLAEMCAYAGEQGTALFTAVLNKLNALPVMKK